MHGLRLIEQVSQFLYNMIGQNMHFKYSVQRLAITRPSQVRIFVLIPMTHAPEIGDENRCHEFRVRVSCKSGTRFWRRI